MSAIRAFLPWRALLPVVLLIWCDASADPISAETFLADAIADEKLGESGQLCFIIRIEGMETAPQLMKDEAREIDRVEYSWAPGGKFRIRMIGKSGPMREVVSDGTVISAGGKIWDARFAWKSPWRSTDESRELEEELNEFMWVYSRLLNLHLHPLSWFQHPATLKTYTDIYTLSLVDDPAPTPNTVLVQRETRSGNCSYLQIGTDEMVYAKADFRPGTPNPGQSYERTKPVVVDGVGRLPSQCVVIRKEVAEGHSPDRWTSELCPEYSNSSVNAEDFSITYASSDLVRWPYGSRVKNSWYGIVNTVKDLWDGISDGVLGD